MTFSMAPAIASVMQISTLRVFGEPRFPLLALKGDLLMFTCLKRKLLRRYGTNINYLQPFNT